MRTRAGAIGLVVVAVALLAAACTPPETPGTTTSTTTTSTTTTTAPPPPRFAVVPLPNRGIAYDKGRGVLLVSVSDTVSVLGNHIVEMDPRTGALGRSVELPGGPSTIAVSDDGSRAYVALRNAPEVAEIDLGSFSIVRSISMGSDPTLGTLYAVDLEVQPGNPEVIAVTRDDCCSSGQGGAAIYDHGVQRPVSLPRTSSPNRLTWGPTPETLYGYYSASTGYPFFVLTVSSTGVTATSPGRLITGNSDIEYAAGAVHATSGQVVDVTGSPVLAGAYITGGQLEVDPATNTTAILNGTTLSRHDSVRLVQKSSETVPSISPRQLVSTGGPYLAAAGDASVLLLGEGVSASGFALPAAPPSVVHVEGSTTVPVTAAEVVASPDGTKLYATVPQAAAAHPGEVVEIDVASSSISRSLFVGADPKQLAISDDGSTLMVGHVSASKVTEVRVSDMSIVRSTQLPIDQWVGDIAAQPGSPSSFAVTEDYQRSNAQVDGTFLVRDGVIVVNPTRIRFAPTSIAFAGGDPSKLYGHDGSSSGFDFTTMSVAANGLTVASTIGEVISGFNVEITAAGGRVFASNGGVVDPTVPKRVGMVSAGQPVAVPALGRLLSITGNKIQEFDLHGFWPIATSTFSGGSTVDATLAGSTLAIATTNGVVLTPLG